MHNNFQASIFGVSNKAKPFLSVFQSQHVCDQFLNVNFVVLDVCECHRQVIVVCSIRVGDGDLVLPQIPYLDLLNWLLVVAVM